MPRGTPVSEEQALEMNRLYKSGQTIAEIAAKYGLHSSSVSRYVHHPFSMARSLSRHASRSMSRDLSTNRTAGDEKEEENLGISAIRERTSRSRSRSKSRAMEYEQAKELVEAGDVFKDHPRKHGHMPEHFHEDRLAFCKQLLDAPRDDVVFGDHKTFMLADGTVYLQYLPHDMPHVPLQHAPTARFSVWLGITANGDRMIDLVEGTLNSEKYVEILSHHFPKKNMKLLHNHSAINIAEPTTRWLKNNKVEMVENMPIHSADLNPAETLWEPIIHMVRAKRPTTAEELRDAIVKSLSAVLTPNFVRDHVETYYRSLEECIDRGGKHV